MFKLIKIDKNYKQTFTYKKEFKTMQEVFNHLYDRCSDKQDYQILNTKTKHLFDVIYNKKYSWITAIDILTGRKINWK
jgi:hypothetical protein